MRSLGLIEQGSRVEEIVEEFEEFPYILFAIVVAVRLVKQLKGLDEDFKALLDDCSLHCLIAEELLEDLNRGHAEVTVAKGDEQIVFEAREDHQPLFIIFLLEILLETGGKYLNVCPLQVLEVVINHILLESLCDIE